MPKAKVLLVDDHAIVRRGVRSLLEAEEEFAVVGEVGSGKEAREAVRRLQPDLVLLDIALPDMSGLEAMAQIKAAAPQTRVVILTMHEDEDYFFRSLKAGADGYVVKGSSIDQILTALRAVLSGGVYLYPSLAKSLVGEYLGAQEGPLIKSLSDREREVLSLIGEGLSNKEIATRLSISVSTVQTHRTRVMEKLGLHSVAELVRYAIRKGIIRP